MRRFFLVTAFTSKFSGNVHLLECGVVASIRSLVSRLTNPLVASRAIVLFLVFAGTVFGYRNGSPPFPDAKLPFLFGLVRWDSRYYLQIATIGFGGDPRNPIYAFRPLYPLILRLLYPAFGWLGVTSAEVMAGLLWNLFAIVLAAMYLEKLTALLLGPKIASRSLLLLAIYPSTLFFSVIYPEATCLLLVAASLYYLESSKVLLAGTLGFLAGLVRPEAFLLAIPFFVKALFEEQKLEKVVGGTTTLLSLPAFGLYSYVQTGDLFAALRAESSWAKCTILCVAGNPTIPPGTLSNLSTQPDTLSYIISLATMILVVLPVVYFFMARRTSLKMKPYHVWAIVVLGIFLYAGEIKSWALLALGLSYIINSATMILAVLPVVYFFMARRTSSKTRPYYVWAIVVLGAFLYAGEIKSWARFALVLPPVFWAQAEYSLNHPRFFQALVPVYGVMMCLATILYVNWYPML